MKGLTGFAAACAMVALANSPTAAQGGGRAADAADDPVRDLVGRLDLERYKATIKGLTQFGDRRQGTKRNRDAVDWIEAQLRSYGCQNIERIRYEYAAPAPRSGAGAAGRGAGAGTAGRGGAGGAGGRGGGAGQGATAPAIRMGQGGSRIFGYTARTGVNNDPMAQKDTAIRAINMEPATDGPREEVICMKVGTKFPNEMYIVGGHMDGHGWGQAANDDGSGSAIVMELARIFSMPDVQTERSIRFALWNNEETGLNGARAYVDQRGPMQGKEIPAGSGKYPEPKWLGMIQHDMMMWDHGMPLPDGTVPKEQRPEADVNVEFQIDSKMADESMKLAFFFHRANNKYATDYPATVGPHMTNTDSGPFQDLVASISLRENERGAQIGGGWDPNWHQPSDVFTTYSDKDFKLGLNAAQTTLGAVGMLTGATIRK
ncbi:MAG: M28 family peptidase [Gemmatimonadota bacterium]|nr:M28 family peptidase [Gemmatimonadota bacterium]